jgi:HD-GYP domain-containing protein (c-di-GMP phosphodiesterase class II)/DNA-binding CsgD family transcriptional regulator
VRQPSVEPAPPEGASFRLAEVVAALSLATDLGTGAPQERGLRACLVAVRLGERLGLAEAELGELYYLVLLAMLGCTASAHDDAAVFGDELAFGAQVAPVVFGEPGERLGWMLRHFAADQPPLRRAGMLARAMAAGPRALAQNSVAHCEVAWLLAERLGFGPAVRTALDALFERWDGAGAPRRLTGEALPLATRVLHVAWNAELFHRLGGAEASVAMTARRAGRALDPTVAQTFVRHAPDVLAVLDTPSPWQAVLAAEPGRPKLLPPTFLDDVAGVVADFADLKSPYTAGHSRGVSALADEAARRLRFGQAEATVLRRAGLVHDLGRVAVSASVWDKPGPLGDAEREQVRLHAYYSERVLGRGAALSDLATLAGLHHERLDGSGYHRAARGAALPAAARVLAAADVYQAITEPRPHRPARVPELAAEEVQREAERGRLDRDAVRAVVEAAGLHPRPMRRTWPGGLSDREVEVVALLGRGLRTKEIAQRLVVSPRTVEHHVQHVYDKLGLRSRAGARLFAIEHGLLDAAPP